MLVQVTEVELHTSNGKLVCFHWLELIRALFFWIIRVTESVSWSVRESIRAHKLHPLPELDWVIGSFWESGQSIVSTPVICLFTAQPPSRERWAETGNWSSGPTQAHTWHSCANKVTTGRRTIQRHVVHPASKMSELLSLEIHSGLALVLVFSHFDSL